MSFERLPQIIRFLLLGGLAAASNWLVRFPLSVVLPFWAAVLVAYMIGMSAGFTLYRAYVFPRSPLPMATQVALFLMVNAGGAVIVMAVSLALLETVLPAAGIVFHPEAIAHAFGIAVGAAANFIGHKHLTFRVSPRTAGAIPS